MQVKCLDEEVLRMIERRDLTPEIVQRIQSWNGKLWQQTRLLLKEHWVWVSAYLEDRRTLTTLMEHRSAAQVKLREIFPETIAWLDQQVATHFEEVLFTNADDVVTPATLYSDVIQRRLVAASFIVEA